MRPCIVSGPRNLSVALAVEVGVVVVPERRVSNDGGGELLEARGDGSIRSRLEEAELEEQDQEHLQDRDDTHRDSLLLLLELADLVRQVGDQEVDRDALHDQQWTS